MEYLLRDRPQDHDYPTRGQAGRSKRKRVNYDETLKRPSWYRDTRDKVFKSANQKKSKSGEILYECALTSKYYPRSQLAVDHRVAWENYCRTNADVTNPESIRESYNDLKNLQLAHSGANSSKGDRRSARKGYLEREIS